MVVILTDGGPVAGRGFKIVTNDQSRGACQRDAGAAPGLPFWNYRVSLVLSVFLALSDFLLSKNSIV